MKYKIELIKYFLEGDKDIKIVENDDDSITIYWHE